MRGPIIAAAVLGSLALAAGEFADYLRAQSIIVGAAEIIDGDTIRISTTTIRLFGIDAPEGGQRCFDQVNRPYNCGSLASDALAEEIAGGIVSCHQVDTDRFNRMVAVCEVAGRDLGDALVRRGYAVDFGRYSQGRYAGAEREARDEKRGMWAGTFQRPESWRREQGR